MLTAHAKSWFSQAWDVFDGRDRAVATLTPSMWSEKGEMRLPGSDAPLHLEREGWASGDFRLMHGADVVVRARKPSAWRSAFVLDVGGKLLRLQPDGCAHTSFTLLDGETPVGKVAKTSWWQRRATIDLPEAWPPPLQVFVFWLVLLIWNRDAAAAST